MKHLSTALVAFSLLTAASAVQAQTPYYGTDFNGTVGYPYTDPTVYADGFTPLDGQGAPAWTSTAGAVSVRTQLANGTTGPVVGQVYSGFGTSTGTHSTGTPTVGGYIFQSDFSITPNNADQSTQETEFAGNRFAFTFNAPVTGAPIFSLVFLPTGVQGGVEAAYQPELVNAAGTVISTATTGPDVGTFFHLSISVSTTGDVSASLGTPNSTVAGNIIGSDAVGSFSITETDVATTTDDAITLNDVSVVVPEPSTYAMMGLGLLGTVGMMKFRRRKA